MARKVVTGLDAPEWLINKLIGLNAYKDSGIEPYRKSYKLVVTDLFGNPLEEGQQVLYAHNRQRWGRAELEVSECTILTVLDKGEIVLRNNNSDRVSTVSSFTVVYEEPGLGTARYMNIYAYGRNQ